MHLDVSHLPGVAEQLDAAGAVDEVEEDELPHLAAGHHAAREAARLVELAAVLERLDLGPNGRDLVPIRKARRRGHGARV